MKAAAATAAVGAEEEPSQLAQLMTDHCRWKSELRNTSRSSPGTGAGLGQRQTHGLQATLRYLRA